MKNSEYKRILKEELGLILHNGIINYNPNDKEKITVNKYKQKEKNITEAITTTGILTFNNINFNIYINLGTRTGEVQLLPKTSKDLDAIENYGKEKLIKLLTLKLKQSLGFPVSYTIDSGAAGLIFEFNLSNIEELLIKKIIRR